LVFFQFVLGEVLFKTLLELEFSSDLLLGLQIEKVQFIGLYVSFQFDSEGFFVGRFFGNTLRFIIVKRHSFFVGEESLGEFYQTGVKRGIENFVNNSVFRVLNFYSYGVFVCFRLFLSFNHEKVIHFNRVHQVPFSEFLYHFFCLFLNVAQDLEIMFK